MRGFINAIEMARDADAKALSKLKRAEFALDRLRPGLALYSNKDSWELAYEKRKGGAWRLSLNGRFIDELPRTQVRIAVSMLPDLIRTNAERIATAAQVTEADCMDADVVLHGLESGAPL